MTYALLILWTATTQTPAPATGQHPPLTVVVTVQPADDGALKRELAATRERLMKAQEEATSPDHALAALLASGRADLTTLRRFSSRTVKSERGARADIDVFLPRKGNDPNTIALVIEVVNPRGAKPWQPTEAKVTIQPPEVRVRGHAERWGTASAAVRSLPRAIQPGCSGRIVLVFDRMAVGLDSSTVLVGVLRDGVPELAFLLRPSDVQPSSETGPGDPQPL